MEKFLPGSIPGCPANSRSFILCGSHISFPFSFLLTCGRFLFCLFRPHIYKTMDNYILAYYQKICDGSEVVGKWIRVIYDIIVHGIQDGKYIFDQKKANNCIRFFEKFVRHNKGALAPQVIQLSLWEKALLSVIFGIVDENGIRVFREVFIVVGRKCGKTLLAAGIIAYMAYLEAEFGSEIYCIAPKLDQSDLVYSAFEFTKDNTQYFAKMTKKRKNDLYIKKTNTTIKKLAFNEKKADGFNPQLTVCDEMSSWPAKRGLKQYEVITSGTISRRQPLTLSISSAGYVDGGIFDELMLRSTKFLNGDSREKRLLPFIYMIDDAEKWDDINELRKSLPGLGVSVDVDTILEHINAAHMSLSKKTEFITKFCNVKQNAVAAWLSTKIIKKAIGAPLSPEMFRSSYCVLGIDLSQTTDLTAAVCIIEKNEKLHILAHFWMPAAKVDDASDRDGLPYRLFIEKGWLSTSGESFVDYRDVFAWCTNLVEQYEILPLMVGYDRYSSQYLVQELEKYGFHTDDVFQGYNLFPAIQTLEGMMDSGLVDIGDNDLLKIHLLDTALKSDSDSRRSKIVKTDSRSHIDGTAATLCGLIVRDKHSETIGEQLKNLA